MAGYLTDQIFITDFTSPTVLGKLTTLGTQLSGCNNLHRPAKAVIVNLQTKNNINFFVHCREVIRGFTKHMMRKDKSQNKGQVIHWRLLCQINGKVKS